MSTRETCAKERDKERMREGIRMIKRERAIQIRSILIFYEFKISKMNIHIKI